MAWLEKKRSNPINIRPEVTRHRGLAGLVGRLLLSTGVIMAAVAFLPATAGATSPVEGHFDFQWGNEIGAVCQADGTWEIGYGLATGWQISGLPPDLQPTPSPIHITAFKLGGVLNGDFASAWHPNPIPAQEFGGSQVSFVVPGGHAGHLDARLFLQAEDGPPFVSPSADQPPVTINFGICNPATKAATATTVTASPSTATLNQAVTFTSTVSPTATTGGPVPTGTVSFFVDGSTTPRATTPLTDSKASFTTNFGGGSHSVVAVYSGDSNFLTSTSSPATTTVSCTRTISGPYRGSVVAFSGTICLVNSQVTGSLVIGGGASLDIENSTIGGSTVATRASNVRMCASTVRGSIAITGSTGFVLIGDAGDDGCVPNVIRGGDVLLLNSGGLEAIGNTIRTSLNLGNSGRGPFPEDAAPEIEGNHP